MGLYLQDVVPTASYGPTAQTPPGKGELHKFIQVARTDTVASVKAVLPASASVIGVVRYGATASDAGTSAGVTITLANNSGTISTGTADVLQNATGYVNMTNLPNFVSVPPNGDIKVSAAYAESGTASTTGGPWIIRITYIP